MRMDDIGARHGLLDRANHTLAAIASLSLLFTVVLIAAGVILRFVFRLPVLGLNEIVQTVSVGVVMLAMPWATASDAHVRVDVLDHAIGRAGRFLGDIASRLLAAFALAVLVWRSGLKALDAWEYGDVTNMISIPLWPTYAAVAVGMALCVVVLLVQTATLLVRGPEA
jgi:TRAP-type C4-dicarboxylate transport system permease small subunit